MLLPITCRTRILLCFLLLSVSISVQYGVIRTFDTMQCHRNMNSSRCLPCMSHLRDLCQDADSREFQRPSTQCRRWMADLLPRYMNLASSFALPGRASSSKILLCPKISPRYRPGPFWNGLAENILQAQNQERYRQTASLQDRGRHVFYWQTIWQFWYGTLMTLNGLL